MKVLVIPRDPNPYQSALYEALHAEGVRATYLHGPTASQTVNLLLRPLHLLVWRLRGFRLVHVHWVYDFVPEWAGRSRVGRRLAQWWFAVTLLAARAWGMRVIWTAHNLLPHEPTFADDVRARRLLARCSSVVLVHGSATQRRVEAMGARSVRVVPQGMATDVPRDDAARREVREEMGLAGARVLVNVGIQRRYKGTDALLREIALTEVPVVALVGGECPDPEWKTRLQELGEACGSQVRLCLQHLDDADLRRWLTAADLGVFPFRQVTNSSSVLLVMGAGVPVVIPDVEELADLPSEAVLRYRSPDGLGEALRTAASLSDADLRAMGTAAREFGCSQTWDDAASVTMEAYSAISPGTASRPPKSAVVGVAS